MIGFKSISDLVLGGGMFFEVEWSEEAGTFRRVYRAENFNTVWRITKHMNIERRQAKRPVMRGIRIRHLRKYEGGFFNITADYEKNMAFDADGSEK